VNVEKSFAHTKAVTVQTYTKAQQLADQQQLNREFKKKHGRERTWEDAVQAFGGRLTGQSQDTGRRNPQSRSSDDGIV